MTFVLGLSGGIATGKSTADRFFKKQKIPVIDSDQIAHQLLEVGQSGWYQVKQQFGPKYLKNDQSIDRAKLGQLVFHNSAALAKLNKLTHPLIYQAIQKKLARFQKEKVPLVVFDAPLLFESHGERYCDVTVVITLPEKLQLQRLMRRNHLSKTTALARINSQLSLAQKEARADYVISNAGTIKQLEAKLVNLLHKIENEA